MKYAAIVIKNEDNVSIGEVLESNDAGIGVRLIDWITGDDSYNCVFVPWASVERCYYIVEDDVDDFLEVWLENMKKLSTAKYMKKKLEEDH